MPYLDNEKAKVSKRKWWRNNRGKARTLEPTLPLEPVKLEPVLEPKLGQSKDKDPNYVLIGGAYFKKP